MKWMVFAAAALGCVAAGTATAADGDSDTRGALAPLTFEVTPYAGYRFGGSFQLIDSGTHVDVADHASFALALDLSSDATTQYELFYSRQSTSISAQGLPASDMVVEYVHVGGTLLLDTSERLQPYLIGSVGATRFNPSAAVGSHRAFFSASIGGGLRVPLNRHLSLRLEARAFATLLNANTAVFCRSDESGALCAIHGRGSSFVQADLLAGAAYSF